MTMGWIVLEALLALVVAVIIVAWTMSARRRSTDETRKKDRR